MRQYSIIFLLFILFTVPLKGQEVLNIATIKEQIYQKEINVAGIKSGNEAKIIWSKGYKEQKSPIAFVYLHGFGASSREGEPIMSLLSKKYDANVYMSRLKEHGLDRVDNFIHLTPENYIASAKEALKIGQTIGNKVILVSTSTGGTLSLKLASEEAGIEGLIMYSPFIGLKNPAFAAILTPEGKAGFIRSNGSEIMKQSRPKEEAKYWSTSYHINGYEALIKMLLNSMTSQTFLKVKTPVFVGYYYKNEKEQDQVVSVAAILKMYDELGTSMGEKIKKAFPNTGNHVIACDLRSNDWKRVFDETVTFIDTVILNEINKYTFELQGHRGARGLAPENTMQAFEKAIDLGVNTIELDIVISEDERIVVSHEPWLNHEITTNFEGNRLKKEVALAFNIFKNKYTEIKKYDVGSIGNPNFLQQEKVVAYKPLLSEVIAYAEAKNPNICYNIEVKSTPLDEAKGYQPSVAIMSDMLIKELKKAKLPINRVVIQSFDTRVLEYIHATYPTYKMAFLTYENDFHTNMKILSFVPQIYSPYFALLNKEEVEKIHKNNMRVIPWTVNRKEDMLSLLNLGVDGIITDYPDIAIPLRK